MISKEDLPLEPRGASDHEKWLALGVSRTVYSLPFPEVRAFLAGELARVEPMLARHDKPWEKSQDGMHEALRLGWERFSAKAGFGMGRPADWRFYPTAGASEALRETLAAMRARGERLAVFEGEYEGYEMMARALGMEVRKVKRARWRDELPRAWAGGFELFVSNPSAVDGQHWRDFGACCELAGARGGRVHLDAAYVGGCALSEPIDASPEAVRSVFFSLSKPFGVYYRRIGGCFSRDPNALLAPNLWFKNLDSIWIGERLLSRFGPGELQRAWEGARQDVAAALSERHGWALRPSDVFLVARSDAHGLAPLSRVAGAPARVCLTPALSAEIERRWAASAPKVEKGAPHD